MKRIKSRKFIAIVLILIIFIPLTYIKFFTAQITIVGDTTTSIVATKNV